MAKFSIIVPCYGVEKYLDRCVESLTNQTFKDIEIILIDDGSPDSVPQMCDDWAGKDLRIKVVHKENGGLGFARNSGLEVASGEYVAFIDSDDFIDLNAFHVYNSYLADDVDAIFCGYKIESRRNLWSEKKESDNVTELCGNDVWTYVKDMVASMPYVKQERKHNMSVWRAIYKRSIIEDNNIRFLSEREVNSEDIPFQLDFLKRATKILLIPDALYNYCLNGASLTTTFNEKKFERYIKMRIVLLDKMSDDKERFLRADRFFIGYVRSYTLQMVKRNVINKKNILDRALSNPVWKDVEKEYKPYYLGPYQGILYWMQLHKWSKIIFVYVSFMRRFKKSR